MELKEGTQAVVCYCGAISHIAERQSGSPSRLLRPILRCAAARSHNSDAITSVDTTGIHGMPYPTTLTTLLGPLPRRVRWGPHGPPWVPMGPMGPQEGEPRVRRLKTCHGAYLGGGGPPWGGKSLAYRHAEFIMKPNRDWGVLISGKFGLLHVARFVVLAKQCDQYTLSVLYVLFFFGARTFQTSYQMDQRSFFAFYSELFTKYLLSPVPRARLTQRAV